MTLKIIKLLIINKSSRGIVYEYRHKVDTESTQDVENRHKVGCIVSVLG
jgi:hypothetical protein